MFYGWSAEVEVIVYKWLSVWPSETEQFKFKVQFYEPIYIKIGMLFWVNKYQTSRRILQLPKA